MTDGISGDCDEPVEDAVESPGMWFPGELHVSLVEHMTDEKWKCRGVARQHAGVVVVSH